MAIDTERSRRLHVAVASANSWVGRASSIWQLIWPRVAAVFRSLPVVRFFSTSLKRRIVASNLLGLAILLGGYFYLNQYKDWLVDAKVDSLTAQGEIIAQAIAANAKLEGERITIDPDVLPLGSPGLAPLRDDGFAALSFSIGPEQIAPVMKRLIQPDIRARVFDRTGTLVLDSKDFLPRRKIGPLRDAGSAEPKPRTKNLWTRMTEYLFTSNLPVLKELEHANGNYYPPVRSAMAGTGTPMLLLDESGQQIVSYAAPIRRASQIHGVLLLSTEPGEIEKVLSKERAAILQLALWALGAAVAVSLLLAYSVAGPIRRLSAAAEAVSRDIKARHTLPDFSHRKDEVYQLSQAFIDMTASLHRRIEASENFAADVAHELKNPLTAARSTAESLAYARTEQQRAELVHQIQEELKRLNKLITDVSNASRLDAELARQDREQVDLTNVLNGVVNTFRDILNSDSEKKIHLKGADASPSNLIVHAHEGRLAQVLTNLIDNAISFSPPEGTITVRARRDGDSVEFVVEDEGPGIEHDKLETVFRRFYTYRPTAVSSRGNNSGLGLSITREIVTAYGGLIWAENRLAADASDNAPSRGARIVVRLPAASTGTTARNVPRPVLRA